MNNPIAPWNDPRIRWVCEDHHTKEQEHRRFPWFWLRCGGAGMPDPKQVTVGDEPIKEKE